MLSPNLPCKRLRPSSPARLLDGSLNKICRSLIVRIAEERSAVLSLSILYGEGGDARKSRLTNRGKEGRSDVFSAGPPRQDRGWPHLLLQRVLSRNQGNVAHPQGDPNYTGDPPLCESDRAVTACYLSPALPGVMLASSGEDGLRCPALFSGVLDRTAVFPGPAVEGLPPCGPEGSTPAWFGVGEGWLFSL